MPPASYWLSEEPPTLRSRRLRGRIEVAVIGGGVTGCSCALALAGRGVRVRLHEARQIASGASGRNGGFAVTGAARPYHVIRGELGRDRARQLMALTERSLDRMELLAGDAFRRTGSVLLAEDADLDALRREHDALLADGGAAEWMDDLVAPLDRLYRAALVRPRDGTLHPARWVRRLAQHAADAGADIREGSRVGVGDLGADAIVVAADGFTAAVLPELAPVAVATRGQMLVTEPLERVVFDRPHAARGGWDYWQQVPDGNRLVLGGQRDAAVEAEQTEREETTPLIQSRLEALVEALVGRSVRVEVRWAGIWASTPDAYPLVGAVPGRDGVYVAGGYSGHGNVLGLACGELVARLVLGEHPADAELFDPARFGERLRGS